ncbi:hypothetical protein [Bradyrhizobium mercantei]|uniref:hypothetical protein n=1 Tax=Bradyrhizobium mercantei TaxID=1904807 RepID=UPI00097798F0|nr:hypothetical protein [Bradyrhizobium mercantei]
MLRFDYMPSDFHPIYLFLGDAADLTALANLLRKFSQSAREVSVVDGIPGSKSRTGLTLVPADDEFGMREVNGSFKWKLNAWQAARIAERIDLLTPEENKSGSDLLEVGSDGEIPVKVSRGEFTDDFLVSKR